MYKLSFIHTYIIYWNVFEISRASPCARNQNQWFGSLRQLLFARLAVFAISEFWVRSLPSDTAVQYLRVADEAVCWIQHIKKRNLLDCKNRRWIMFTFYNFILKKKLNWNLKVHRNLLNKTRRQLKLSQPF
jgi:hypothetical protein